jgi:hypothetical protein
VTGKASLILSMTGRWSLYESPKSKVTNAFDPFQILDVHRLIQPVELLGLFDHLAGDRLRLDALPSQLLDLHGDGIAGGQLDDEEGDQRDAEKSGNDEEDAFEQVGGHGAPTSATPGLKFGFTVHSIISIPPG